ncbi:uncharacterized protein TNCV_2460081 [Trichonephila clavipes]|nr:uncharacterized protein TNCV_2460081 [Trichonephila clavipes]
MILWEIKINPDYYSVFWVELLAIEEALKFYFTESVSTDIWILSDSRSSIQHLSKMWRHGDRTTRVVQLLISFSANVKIFFQWVPWHVNVCGNEIADGLAREGSHKDFIHEAYLTFLEIATRVKQDISSSWRQAPVHEWYERNLPGAALLGTSSRREETSFARLLSGHTRSLRHVEGLQSLKSLSELQCEPSRSCPHLGLHWLP